MYSHQTFFFQILETLEQTAIEQNIDLEIHIPTGPNDIMVKGLGKKFYNSEIFKPITLSKELNDVMAMYTKSNFTYVVPREDEGVHKIELVKNNFPYFPLYYKELDELLTKHKYDQVFVDPICASIIAFPLFDVANHHSVGVTEIMPSSVLGLLSTVFDERLEREKVGRLEKIQKMYNNRWKTYNSLKTTFKELKGVFAYLPTLYKIKKEMKMTKYLLPMPLKRSVIYNSFVGYDLIEEKENLKAVRAGPLINRDVIINEEKDKEVMQLIEESQKNGKNIIYVAFGSTIAFKKEAVEEMLTSLAKREEIVIFATKRFPEGVEIPKNVHVFSWVNQKLVLSQSNTVLFLSHGGMSSIYEAIHFKVPLLVIPGVEEELFQGRRVERGGLGLVIILDKEFDSYHISDKMEYILSHREQFAESLTKMKNYAIRNNGREKAANYILNLIDGCYEKQKPVPKSLKKRAFWSLVLIFVMRKIFLKFFKKGKK